MKIGLSLGLATTTLRSGGGGPKYGYEYLTGKEEGEGVHYVALRGKIESGEYVLLQGKKGD